jgi:hypothetical protein
MIEHPSYSPDLALADFFLFPPLKMQLAGLALTQNTFKNIREGVTLSIDDFATTFEQ